MSRNCPACDSSSQVPFSSRGGYRVVTCEQCGLRYLDRQPTAADVDALYGAGYFQHASAGDPGYDRYLEEVEHIRRTFDHRLKFLPAPGPGKRLLDVGAAIGLFVERARLVGWEAVGLDPSSWACQYAVEVLKQPVQCGTVEHAGFLPASFDVVTMWEVIEHLPHPRSTLATVAPLLRPGGLVILSTPDAGSLVARLLGRRWPGWGKVPEHLTFFDKQSLGRVLRDSGFRVEDQRYVSLVVSRRYLFDRVASVVGIRRHGGRTGRWMTRPIRVNPYYDLMVTARRR